MNNKLREATIRRRIKDVRDLLSQGADPNAAIALACKAGYIEIVEVLIGAGASPGLGFEDAIYGGWVAIVAYLYAFFEPDLNKPLPSGKYPLQVAKECQYEDMYDLLVSLGANPKACEKQSR